MVSFPEGRTFSSHADIRLSCGNGLGSCDLFVVGGFICSYSETAWCPVASTA